MKLKYFFPVLILLNSFFASATPDRNGADADTLKPAINVKMAADSNILVVIDGKIISRGKNIKSMDEYVNPDSISHVNVLKGQDAVNKYGPGASDGAVEIFTIQYKSSQEKIINGKMPEPDAEYEVIFEKVDIEASFPGGDQAWRSYLVKNLKPDIPVEKGSPAGLFTTIIQFIVDKDGKISEVKALTNFGYGMEEEVMRVIKSGPAWKPASQNGKMVKAYRRQPVTFLVDDESVSVTGKRGYVLNAGADNMVRIEMYKVKDNDLEFSLTDGTIARVSEGQYNIRADKPGRIVLSIINSKKKSETGRVSFEVK